MDVDNDRCGCGAPLHYADRDTERLITSLVREMGPTVVVRTNEGAWHVPRHFLACHTLKAEQLATLAAQHGWAPVV